jgi:hypothetical protein
VIKKLRGGGLAVVRRPHTRRQRESNRTAVSAFVRLVQSAAIETLPVSNLRPDPNNPRRHSDRQVAQIAASIAKFGFITPILIDEENRVLAGHGRLLAAKKLRLSGVRVVRVEHLTAAEKRAFMLADNRLVELSEWDFGQLKVELDALTDPKLEFDYEVTGFNSAYIDRMLGGALGDDGSSDPADDIPIVCDSPPVSRIGDVWRLGHHRLICGDARHVDTYEQLLGSTKAAMVFTDPPYNVRIDGNVAGRGRHREFIMASGELSPHEFKGFLERSFRLAREFSNDGAIHFVCMDWRHLWEILAAAAPVYGVPKQLCVWVKDNAGMGTFYRSRHELVFVFKVGTATHTNNFGLGERSGAMDSSGGRKPTRAYP